MCVYEMESLGLFLFFKKDIITVLTDQLGLNIST